MKTNKIISAIGILLGSAVFSTAFAEDTLEGQLDALKLPENAAPAGITQESLYSV